MEFKIFLCIIFALFTIFNIFASQPTPGTVDLTSPVNLSEYHDLDEATIRKVQVCERNEELMELCMRCTKVTKSYIVYPMCCANEEDVTKWCHDYVYFSG